MPDKDHLPISYLSNKDLEAFLQSPESLPVKDAIVFSLTPPQKRKGLLGVSKAFMDAPTSVQTILWIDTTKRPEIRDLPRVHDTDGLGSNIVTFSYINPTRLDCYFILQFDLKTPVRVSFRIPIFMNEWHSIIDTISQTGSLSILIGPPVKWRELRATLTNEELATTIYEQSGGGITLSFDDVMKRELRQAFENYIEAMAKLLRRG